MTQTSNNIKNITLALTFVFSLLLGQAVLAEDTVVKSQKGLIGSVHTAVVKNAKSAQIGSIDTTGNVKDASGKVLGSIDKDGFVRKANNQIAGQVDYKTGVLMDHRNTLVGLLDSEGNIRNLSGAIVGSYSKNGENALMNTAAILFFFDNMSILPCSAVSEARVFIYNKTGVAEGFLQADGTINDKVNMKKGSLDIEGYVKDAFNNVSGKIESDGTVRSATGSVVETFSPQDPNFTAKAVYMLLFSNNSGNTSASL